jgi:hypothetical protein
MKHIKKKHIGNTWTDHNLHDPGITLLEHLAYAISDLCYRLGFEIEDLLAENDKEDLIPFFTSQKSLPSFPLTLLDYRKLLIDQPGIKNVWVQTVKEPEPYLYFDQEKKRLHSGWTDKKDEVILQKGRLKVQIELENPDEPINAQSILEGHRNLCEDFEEVKFLDEEKIGIDLNIELYEDVRPLPLENEIKELIMQWISPSIPFYSLEEMLKKGRSPEEIFQGPLLNNGFIDEEDLRKYDKKNNFRGSDLLHLLMDLEEVKVVRELKMGCLTDDFNPDKVDWETGENSPILEKQYLTLKNIDSKAPRLSFLRVQFFKGENLVYENHQFVEDRLGNSRKQTIDLPVPKGKNRNPGRFFSITQDLPNIYGVGESGLPPSADQKRQAQAKQLKAYIAFFEQLLLGYFSQLNHFKDLFSLNFDGETTYFPKGLWEDEGISQYEDLLLNSKEQHLKNIHENSETAVQILERKGRRLDHLLARLGEQLPDPSLFGMDQENNWKRSTQQKYRFLNEYEKLGANRSRAFNYKNDPSPENISGLLRRMRMLLGHPLSYELSSYSNLRGEIFESSDSKYKFRIFDSKREQKFLVSTKSYSPRQLAIEMLYKSIALLNNPENLVINKTNHTPQKYQFTLEKDRILLAKGAYYYKELEDITKIKEEITSITYPTCELHMVEHSLLRPKLEVEAKPRVFEEQWSLYDTVQHPYKIKDPWSLQLSFILSRPEGTSLQNKKLEAYVDQLVKEETPCHLTPRFKKVGIPFLISFKALTDEWKKKLAQNQDAEKEKEALNQMLRIAKKIIVVKAFQFKQKGDRVKFHINNNSILNQIVFSFWAKVDSHIPIGITPFIWSSGDFYIAFSPNTVTFACGDDNTLTSRAFDPKQIYNKWTHWTFVKKLGDKNTMIIFINGEEFGKEKEGVSTIPNEFDLVVGNPQNKEFTWAIADMQLWSIFKAAQLENREFRLRGREPGLLAYWKFNKFIVHSPGPNIKTYIPDESENNFDGLIEGGEIVEFEIPSNG